jgi:parallel beta-helix repeat protein
LLFEKKAISRILLTLLLANMFLLAFNIQPIKATLGTVYIMADGSIYPPEAPISTIDNVTYTLTGNIITDPVSDSMHIYRDNIVLDGSGFLVDGSASQVPSWVILLNGRSNVTIQNIRLKGNEVIRLQDETSNVTVQNTSIEGLGGDRYSGIWISWSSNITIVGNTVTGEGYGIYLDHGYNNHLTRNTVTRSWVGINIYHSSNNDVTENNITNSSIGIGLYWTSSGNTIDRNTITDNVYGIRFDDSSNYNNITGNTLTHNGLYVSGSYPNNVENNTVNDRPLVYLEDAADLKIEDAGQVVLVRCDRIKVEDLSIARASVAIELWQTDSSILSGNHITWNRGYGIAAYYSFNNTICGNTLADNGEGISLYSSSKNIVVGNNMTTNGATGIVISFCSDSSVIGNNVANNVQGISVVASTNNTIARNTIDNNGYGINLASNGGQSSYNNSMSRNNVTNNSFSVLIQNCSSNKFHYNNFINNSHQVIFSPLGYSDIWDNGYASGGNYWGDYNGTDLNSGPYQNLTGSDGIGDTPYFIDANNRDNYPFMKQISMSEHDIGILSLSLSKSVCGQGYTLNESIMIFNYGGYTEAFNVTAYANSTIIDTQTVNSLHGGLFAVLTFRWNTTGFVYGNYTLDAYAEPVQGEEFTADNNCTATFSVHVGIPGDCTGPVLGEYDGKCGMRDIQYMIMRFNGRPSEPRWDPNADVNDDNVINMRDIQIAIINFGKQE